MVVHEPQNPLLRVWLRNFAFTYWDNRIEKISLYNSEDRLEALFVLMQLSDLYAHLFSVQVRNPDQPWFMVTEKTYKSHIENTLKKLDEDTERGPEVFVSRLEEADDLVSFEKVREEADVDMRDIIARRILGVPSTYNEEEETLEFSEDMDLHFGAANATLNFWRENVPLLNDFKHGFRVLPFDRESLAYLNELGFFPDQEEHVEELQEEMEENTESSWGIHFLRMETEQVDDRYDVTVHIHYANAQACLEMSRVILRQLHNLFNVGRTYGIEEYFEDLILATSDDSGVFNLIEHVGSFDVYYDPNSKD